MDTFTHGSLATSALRILVLGPDARMLLFEAGILTVIEDAQIFLVIVLIAMSKWVSKGMNRVGNSQSGFG